jgi:hypothetical protein
VSASDVGAEMFDEVQQVAVLFAGNGVEINGEETGCRIVNIDFKQELVVLQSCSEASFFAKDVDELEDGHEEAD